MPQYQGAGSSGITGGWTTNYTYNYTITASTSTSSWTHDWYPLGYVADNVPVRFTWSNEPFRQVVEETPEEQEERVRGAQANQELIQRERQEREAAATRAETLLLSFLSEEQRASYRDGQRFEIVGSLGGRYRIRPGRVGNIDWLDENGQVGGSLCCHPSDEFLPRADVMLAQMLALITDEEGFVRLANRYNGNPHPLQERLLQERLRQERLRRRVGV